MKVGSEVTKVSSAAFEAAKQNAVKRYEIKVIEPKPLKPQRNQPETQSKGMPLLLKEIFT